jgi:glutamyl-tRNA synthetase
MVKGRDTAMLMLDAVVERFATCEWTTAGLEDALFGFGDAEGIKRGQAQAPIRVAVTGRTVGPPLLESLELLGRDETLSRLENARTRVASGWTPPVPPVPEEHDAG